MKRFKKAVILGTIAVMIFSMSAVSASALSKPAISVDGKAITFQASEGTPFIDSANRTQVPIRAFAESLGAKVSWDGTSQTATIDGNIKIKVGSAEITTAYGTVKMDTNAVNKSGRIYVPARYVANALGFDIESTSKNGAVEANVVTKVELTVSAAASLKDALGEIQTLYKKDKPNATLNISFGGSGTLQQQIEQGAPVDCVLLSCKEQHDRTERRRTCWTDGTVKESTAEYACASRSELVRPPIDINSFEDCHKAVRLKRSPWENRQQFLQENMHSRYLHITKSLTQITAKSSIRKRCKRSSDLG